MVITVKKQLICAQLDPDSTDKGHNSVTLIDALNSSPSNDQLIRILESFSPRAHATQVAFCTDDSLVLLSTAWYGWTLFRNCVNLASCEEGL